MCTGMLGGAQKEREIIREDSARNGCENCTVQPYNNNNNILTRKVNMHELEVK